jgi:N-acetylmuramoyl-L-alanine amidase
LKIRTFNLKKHYVKIKFTILALVIAMLIPVFTKVISAIYTSSDAYQETLSEITEKNVIIIDAGHGGEDCGAIGVSGIYEKDLNLLVANELGKMLSEKGYAVIYTRSKDELLLYTEDEKIYGVRKISDLKNRCKFGAEYPNAIYVSIHMNSFGNEKCSGLQVYYSEKNAESYDLANAIQTNVKSRLQQNNNRKIKKGESIYLLENLTNPAILIECGFLTNPEECEKLSEKEYQKELCFAILCGIIEYRDKNTK